jgi:hypothetical protein
LELIKNKGDKMKTLQQQIHNDLVMKSLKRDIIKISNEIPNIMDYRRRARKDMIRIRMEQFYEYMVTEGVMDNNNIYP